MDNKEMCEKCYWKDTRRCNQCKDLSKFNAACHKCNQEIARFELESKLYCADCMMYELGIAELETVLYDYYDKDGCYLGRSTEYEDEEIIKMVNNEVKCLKDKWVKD